MSRKECLLKLYGIICCFQSVSGFAAGPPFSTCLTLFPKHHGLEAQTTEPPYTIDIQENDYIPGQDIHMTVGGKNGRKFMGLQIAVHRDKGDTEELIGEFTSFPSEKLRAMNCIDGKKNMIGHKNNDIVTEVNITWKASAVNQGNLTIFISIVESFDIFWINIMNPLPSHVDIPVVPVKQISKHENINIDFEECGESLGCILYPSYCTGDDCYAGATFRDEGNRTRFKAFVEINEGYISLGFSDDRLMGDDHTISCTFKDDQYTVQHGYNPLYFNYRQYKKDEIHDMTVSVQDGKLYCEFTRPNYMSVVNMMKPTERLGFDLNNDYYVMIAWGYLHRGSSAITHHIELPVTTDSKVNFKSTSIYRGSALPSLTQVHALLMIVAWILFTGLATIIARYFKSSFGEKMAFGAKIWFQTHRAAAVISAVITAISFIIIFVKVDGLTEVAEAHAYVGIVLMSVTTLQVFGGLLRPGPDSKMRPLFNWGHWLVGKTAHILAAVSIFLAFTIELIPKTQSTFGVVIASIWVVCQVLWELFYEMRRRRRESQETKEKSTLQKADMILLVVYVINMLIVLTVSIMAIYFF
ncbi:putative ferric-chelate reductase 1 [Mytilus californianus]|uniref:putative ferric-chelate reductase 1 n=1 Tax=Mytilus californianus TaxID=6549 RepID=UPI0022482788|nr:putative ferric-chelate reductase 1 [Mytilus californianus]